MIGILIISILSSLALAALLRIVDGKRGDEMGKMELDRAAIRERETRQLKAARQARVASSA